MHGVYATNLRLYDRPTKKQRDEMDKWTPPMTDHKDNPQIRPAPDRVKIWPFTAIDRPDGERAWSGGHWGSLSATMPHSTEYVRADLAQSQIKAAEAVALRKAATNPTREECYSAALSRDHGLGLRSQEEKDDAILEAEWWFLAWRHRILALIDDQSALDAALLAAKEEGFWIGRSTGGSRAEIDAAIRAMKE